MADAAEAATQAYVWAWLPDAVDPVLAGRIDREGPLHTFTYGRSYLARDQAMPLYLPELPLVERIIQPLAGEIAGCLRDAAPDGWGQRVIENAHVSAGGTHALGVLDYLLRSSANRIGALGFSRSVDAPPSSGERGASLDELVASAERVEAVFVAQEVVGQRDHREHLEPDGCQCGFGFVWLEVRADFGRATLKPKRIYGFYLMTKLSLRR